MIEASRVSAPAGLVAALVLVVPVSLAGVVYAQSDDEARDLASRVLEHYASVASYRDAGSVVVSIASRGGDGRSVSRFSTRFARPDRLRFDWERDGETSGRRAATVWSTPGGAFLAVDGGAPVRQSSVEAAMLAAGGDTSSVLYLVPRYLLMSEQCCGYRSLPGARIIGDERDGERVLRVLEFDYSDRLRRRLWIDERSLLIHRVETASEQGDHRVRTVVTFDDIAVDEPIDESVFRVASRKIGFDLARLDAAGLRGPADGKAAVSYEFCIPVGDAPRAEVAATDATARCTRGSPGRIGCAAGEMLCIGSTQQPGWRLVLEELAALPYVDRIEEAFFE